MAGRTYTFQNGQTADGGQVETEFNEIYTNITNDNIAAAASIDISKTDLGTYTPWTNYTPSSYVGSGSMTFTGVTVTKARYMQIGKLVIVEFSLTGTSGGVASISLGFTAPIAPSGTSYAKGAGIFADQTVTSTGQSAWISITSGNIFVSKYNTANWGLTSGQIIEGIVMYEVA